MAIAVSAETSKRVPTSRSLEYSEIGAFTMNYPSTRDMGTIPFMSTMEPVNGLPKCCRVSDAIFGSLRRRIKHATVAKPMQHEQAEQLLRAACEFQGREMQAREMCRDEYRDNETNEENVLRIRIDGQIGLLAEQVTKKVETVSPTISYQIGLCASFIRTHFLISDFSLDGHLLEAIVLSRKQLEFFS